MNHHMPHPAAVERAMSAAQQLLASLGADAEDEAIRESALEGETDALELCRKIVRFALDSEAMAEAAERREADLRVRRARFEARANTARETAKAMLDALGVNRIQSEDFTVSLKLGPPKVLITDEQQLPPELFRVKRSPDLTAIGKALDAGPVQGAVKTNGSLVLAVRTK